MAANQGSVDFAVALPADQRKTDRAITIRCTSVQRMISGALPFRFVARVPHAGRGQSAGSQARWRMGTR